jgi:hypothetical protein
MHGGELADVVGLILPQLRSARCSCKYEAHFRLIGQRNAAVYIVVPRVHNGIVEYDFCSSDEHCIDIDPRDYRDDRKLRPAASGIEGSVLAEIILDMLNLSVTHSVTRLELDATMWVQYPKRCSEADEEEGNPLCSQTIVLTARPRKDIKSDILRWLHIVRTIGIFSRG